MSEQKHTPEPWIQDGGYLLGDGENERIIGYVGYTDDELENAANRARIVSCVNALAGIGDPAKAIEQARDVLLSLKCSMANEGHRVREGHGPTPDAENYEMWARKAESALAALTPKPEVKQ